MIEKISVIVCTLDRPASLVNTLQSIEAPRTPGVSAEIVVVDNGSGEAALRVVTRLAPASRLPIRWLRETRRGLSAARNRGLASTSADVLAFIDDDALAEPGWLDALLDALTTPSAAMAAGGPVRPAGVACLPDWLPPRLYSHLSILDYGDRPKSLTYPYYPFGTNMAVRREAFEGVGGFDTRLGRMGAGSLMTGEETDLFLRIEKAGGVIRYQPAAAVRHVLDPQRLRPGWIYAQTLRIGYSAARMERKSMPAATCLGHALEASARVPVAAGAWLLAACSRNTRLRVLAHSVVSNALGYLRGSLSSVGAGLEENNA